MDTQMFILLFILSTTCMKLGESQLRCNDQSFGLTVLSKRNQTGHSITKYYVTKSARQLKSFWKLDVGTCLEKLGESQIFKFEATVTDAPPKPNDYEFFPGVGYYKLYINPSNFGEAMRICLEDGGHLAVINSEAEYNVLMNLRQRYPKATSPMFLGFHDQIKEGEYITIFGYKLNDAGFLKWNSNDPNGGTNENCGCLIHNSFLCDVSCATNLSFFCEYDLSWNDDN